MMPWLYLWCLCLIATTVFGYKELSDDALKRVTHFESPNDLTPEGDLLKPFLVPRVSGTPGNERVRKHIIDYFQTLGWHVELDSFNDTTPYGVKHFTNVIVTKNPHAPGRLVLSAHFDSKYFADFDFIGATDSAAPCAILLDVASALNSHLETPAAQEASNTLQMIFFDGEEAFVSWSEKDSTYGSRYESSTG